MEMPTITIELQGMRQQIVHAFNAYNKDMTDLVNEEIERKIRDFDWRGEIDKVAEAVLREAIKRSVEEYFFRGDGYRAIHDVVKEVAPQLFKQR